MTPVLLGVGSNFRRFHHISLGLDALAERFGTLRISRVFESEPVGCRGNNYLNLVVALETQMPVAALSGWLKRLEDQCGRERGADAGPGRSLDIDILTFGDTVGTVDGVQLPRGEITRNAFVLQPLAELVPQQRHPVLGVNYAQLWREYGSSQKLWPVYFDWRGRVLSRAEPGLFSTASGRAPADVVPTPPPTPSH